jgi:hypothetical protein
MASTYSPLKIELIGTGEQVATWGQTTNTNLGTTIEQAIGGKADVTMSSTSETLTLTDTNALQDARALYLNLTGTPGGAATLNVPAVQKAYIVKNGTTGGFAVTVKVSGQTGVSVPNGATMHLYNNGTDVVNAVTNLPAGSTIGGSPISSASGTVSSVAAGNGMSFSTITTSGSVTLGTPSTLNTTTTNNVSGSTHTHAITTASASTASTIVARDSLGGFEATTIGMTTGNIGTLNVGTQLNKATISYTTNTARTLTIPAVTGNRTFAFLEEIQTFTANQTIGANLTFTGNSRRLIAPFDGAHQNANAFSVQNSTTDAGTVFGIIPNGTNKGTGFYAYTSSTDALNCNYGFLYADNTQVKIDSNSVGTGVTTKIRIDTDDFERITITPTGEVSINDTPISTTSLKIASNGRTYSLQADNRVKFNDAYSFTVGATNRTLYIDSTGDIGGLSSTRESKTNIAPITDASWLMSLEPVSYNRRERNEDGGYTDQYNTNTEFGLIADDVVGVRPELCVMVNGKVSGINYEQLIAPMLKEIQTLRAEINALKEKLNG